MSRASHDGPDDGATRPNALVDDILGPNFFAIAERKEIWAFYALGFGVAGYTAVGSLFAGSLITFLAAGASLDGTIFPLGQSGPSLYYSSYAQLINVISSLIQVVVYIFIGLLGDFGPLRKQLLFACVAMCAIFIWLVWLCHPSISFDPDFPSLVYGLAAGFFILSTAALGLCAIFFNSYLPILARNHHSRAEAHNFGTAKDQKRVLHRVTDELAGWSTVYGFAGSIAALILSITIVAIVDAAISNPSPAFPNRNNLTVINGTFGTCPGNEISLPSTADLISYMTGLTLAGLFLIVSSVPALLHLKTRPGQSLRGNFLLVGPRAISRGVSRMRSFPWLFLFLLSNMFVSTGITTLGFSASILFSQEVQLSATELAGAVAVSFVSGGLSAAGFLQLVRRYGRNIRGKWVLVALVGVSCAIPLWAFFALDTTVEAFLVTILFGVVIGGIQFEQRSCYSLMIPAGKESEFQSYISISGRLLSWLGPLVVLFVNQVSCNFRQAILTTVGFLACGGTILVFVDFNAAYRQANAKAETMD